MIIQGVGSRRRAFLTVASIGKDESSECFYSVARDFDVPKNSLTSQLGDIIVRLIIFI
jgi:hypothetical protein